MTAGVLALQGAFIEHENMLKELGISSVELREKSDLDKPFDFLVLPGGESSVQGKLLHDLYMFNELQNKIQDGMPVFATCAGLILLAENIENDENSYFKTLPVTVRRNAYGRQLGSFSTELDVKNIGTIPATFIRAPYITSAENDVDVLAKVDEEIVAVQYKKQLAISFHPELDHDLSMYRYFLQEIVHKKSSSEIYP